MADIISSLQAAAGAGGAEETDENFNQTVLLLHGDGTNGAQNNTFLDSSTNNFTITRNGNTTQGTFSPFSAPDGRWSVAFDGSNDGVMYNDGANSYFDLSSANWTFECWVYRNVTGAQHGIFQIADGSGSTIGTNGAVAVYINSSNVLGFFTPSGSGLGSNSVTGTTTIGAGVWHHVAVTRSSNTFTLYLNGTSEGSFTASGTFTNRSFMHLGYYYGNDAGGGIGSFLNGYLSNVRFVNGTAITPPSGGPTSPLTDVTNTDLLTFQSNRFVDNSANNLAVDTFRSTPKVTPFSPFAPTAAYDASVNGGSSYYDNSGDFLSVANDPALLLGTDPFTIHAWIYLENISSNNIIVCKGNSDTTGTWQLGVLGTSGLVRWWWNASSTATSTIAVKPYEWTHIAVVREGTGTNELKVYINGVADITATVSQNFTNTGLLKIGRNRDSNTNYPGYIAGLAIVRSAVWTANFTPPSAPPTAITNTSLLCNFTNAGIFDQTGKNVLETVGNAQIDTTTKKYGTGAMKFDGTGDYLLLGPSTPDLLLGTGPFTIEFWFNTTSSTRYAQFIGNEVGGSGENGFSILINNDSSTSGDIAVYRGSSGLINSATDISYRDGNWRHLAFVRDAAGSRLYIDGTQKGTTAAAQASTSFDSATSLRMVVGANLEFTGRDYLGFIDDFRITKGVARYTTAFTPPDKAFPNIGA